MSKSSPHPAFAQRNASSAEIPSGLLGEIRSEVSVEAAPLLQFIARHASLIMTLVALFTLFVIGFGVRQWHVGKRDEEAQLNFSRLLAQPQGAARTTALERFAEEAPESVRLAALMEFGHAALAAGDAEKAAAAYGRAAAQDKNGALGGIAGAAQAQGLLKAGKAAEALALLELLENVVSESLRRQVRMMLADAALAAGRPDRAVQAYVVLSSGAHGEETEFFRFRLEQLKNAQPVKK